jgi:O-antigen/teichoic acid export membrane protein
MPNNYLSLSPSDFETLAADILSALLSVHFERYGEGRDGGVDGKYVTSDGGVWVVQAKRYRDVNALLRQMGHEQKKMQQLPQAPARYFLVTACSLSPTNKAAIQQVMGPFILSTGDIYGAEDLDALLHQYPAIYRKHHRLWLHGVEQLTQYSQRAHYIRAETTYERIIHESKSYVAHSAEHAINQQLATQNSCLIVGDPGIGKSATAGQIALRHLLETPQAELIWIDDRNFEQALIQKSKAMTEEDASTIFYVNLFLGVCMYVLLYFSAPAIAAFYKQPVLIDIARILFIVILVNALSIVVRAKLTIDIDFKSQAIAGTIAVILSSAIGLYLALNDYGIWSLVWLILSKAFFLNIGLWLFCHWHPKLLFSTQSFIQLFKFGSNLMLAGIGVTLLNNFYIALIGRYFNPASVGYYTQATNLSNFLSTFISSTLQGVTYPIMTSIKEDRTRLLEVYKQLISITMLVSLPMLVGFAAVADTAVLLFLGEEWLPTVPVLITLCLARAMTPISAININILNAIGRSDLFLKVDLSKYPMVIAGFFIGINYGIEGVAWAMFTTTFLSFFVNAYFPGKFFGFGGIAQLKVAYKYIIAAAFMYFSVQHVYIDTSLWVTLVAKIVLGAFIYLVVVLLLRDRFLLDKLKPLIKTTSSGS